MSLSGSTGERVGGRADQTRGADHEELKAANHAGPIDDRRRFACGFVGLTVAVIDRSWKLGIVGWFAGGTLLAALAMAILIDSYQRIGQADLNLEQAER